MITRLALAAAAAASIFVSVAEAAPGVRIQHAAARVVVIPEARGDVSVSISGGDPRLPRLKTHVEGETLVVEGGLERRLAGCGQINLNVFAALHHRAGEPAAGQRVMVRGVGVLTLDHLPTITVRTPRRTSVAAEGAVWGEIRPTERLALASSGCGDWRVANVVERLDVSIAGSGDVGAGQAGSLGASLAGSGDLAMGDVAGDAQLALASSGDVRLGRVSGALHIRSSGSGDVLTAEADGGIEAALSGSGDIVVNGGRSPNVAVQVVGSGGFTFKGEARALAAQTSGSGDVHVRRVTGPVSRSSAGSGEIVIGGS